MDNWRPTTQELDVDRTIAAIVATVPPMIRDSIVAECRVLLVRAAAEHWQVLGEGLGLQRSFQVATEHDNSAVLEILFDYATPCLTKQMTLDLARALTTKGPKIAEIWFAHWQLDDLSGAKLERYCTAALDGAVGVSNEDAINVDALKPVLAWLRVAPYTGMGDLNYLLAMRCLIAINNSRLRVALEILRNIHASGDDSMLFFLGPSLHTVTEIYSAALKTKRCTAARMEEFEAVIRALFDCGMDLTLPFMDGWLPAYELDPYPEVIARLHDVLSVEPVRKRARRVKRAN